MCTLQDLIDLIYRIVHFAVMVLAPLAVTAMLVYGAFLIILYGANPNFLAKGRATMLNAVIGLLVVWGAWIIVNSVFWFFGFTLPCGGAWYRISSC